MTTQAGPRLPRLTPDELAAAAADSGSLYVLSELSEPIPMEDNSGYILAE